MPFRPSQLQRDRSIRVCCSHQSHFGIRVALVQVQVYCCWCSVTTFLTSHIQYLPLYNRKWVKTVISTTASWFLSRDVRPASIFKSWNGLTSIDVKLFNKLHWLPIDDIIRIRKLYLLHKINQGHCPAYFNKYIEHISNTHNYNTRSASNNNITTPACKRNSGLRTFHSSACRLWNALDPEPKTLSHTNFKNYLVKFYRSMTSFLDHFKIRKTF